MQAEQKKSLVGEEYEVEIGPVAHGGHCIARTSEGQVLFVRHTLPGERVVARVTEGEEGDRFLRADAVEVLSASKDRIEAPCPFAGPGQAGGAAPAEGRGHHRTAAAARGTDAGGRRLGRHGDAGRG